MRHRRCWYTKRSTAVVLSPLRVTPAESMYSSEVEADHPVRRTIPRAGSRAGWKNEEFEVQGVVSGAGELTCGHRECSFRSYWLGLSAVLLEEFEERSRNLMSSTNVTSEEWEDPFDE